MSCNQLNLRDSSLCLSVNMIVRAYATADSAVSSLCVYDMSTWQISSLVAGTVGAAVQWHD